MHVCMYAIICFLEKKKTLKTKKEKENHWFGPKIRKALTYRTHLVLFVFFSPLVSNLPSASFTVGVMLKVLIC